LAGDSASGKVISGGFTLGAALGIGGSSQKHTQGSSVYSRCSESIRNSNCYTGPLFPQPMSSYPNPGSWPSLSQNTHRQVARPCPCRSLRLHQFARGTIEDGHTQRRWALCWRVLLDERRIMDQDHHPSIKLLPRILPLPHSLSGILLLYFVMVFGCLTFEQSWAG
jgi:hypothetical protein